MHKAAMLLLLALLPACSVVLEATRPDPTDMSQFTEGESRVKIRQILGAPTATVQEGNNSCDYL